MLFLFPNICGEKHCPTLGIALCYNTNVSYTSIRYFVAGVVFIGADIIAFAVLVGPVFSISVSFRLMWGPTKTTCTFLLWINGLFELTR